MAGVDNSAAAILKRDAEELGGYFERVLAWYGEPPGRLMEAVRYSLLAGGKRLRPSLVLRTFAACGGSGGGRGSALAAAGAIEMIHTFSLVHDDLPAMDNDDLRRGRATNHKVFGEAVALLAGDAMVTMAFELLAREAERRLVGKLVAELAGASGPEGMIGGQILDMEGEGKVLALGELQRMHGKKTGALLTAACRMGAVAAEATEGQLAAVTRFGRHLGLAFQIVDDVLDVTATAEQMGKATNKDARKGKNTYPVLMG
ncbi:MAG: polyprenyl synthetase family protein, partial [Planctomycetota bacterium]|nr:polyprenyl synthetase family protein [Planctomycetota bacterium]